MRYANVNTATRISRIGLGTWQFGSKDWGYGDRYAREEAPAIVRRALDLGVTLFDTAETYSAGRSERILGRALQGRLDDAFLATKYLPLLPTAAAVEQRAVASASRLGAHALDLYQVHKPNPLLNDERLMRGMRTLQRVGVVREVGVSNYSVARWRSAEESLGGRVLSNQVRYSLVARAPEAEIIPYAEARGRLVIAYSPLAQGLLSGRFDPAHRPQDSWRGANPVFSAASLERAEGLLAALREVADAHRCTPAQVSLAWVVHHPCVVAIPGASSVRELEENAAAADIELRPEEYEALRVASDRFSVASLYSPEGRVTTARLWARSAKYLAATMREDRQADRMQGPPTRARDGGQGGQL